MSGNPVRFVGEAMAGVVQAVDDVQRIIGRPPVVVGGLAVMCRLTQPYRATTDLDVVDRLRGDPPQLQVLRAAPGVDLAEPAAVLLPTRFGSVKVDVLEVRQIELDEPSDDPGDRLHASAHAWAYETATPVEIRVDLLEGATVGAVTPVAEPGPLVAMKLQAVMNRGAAKQGTDLQDIVRLVLDPGIRDVVLDQTNACPQQMKEDVSVHADLWLVRRRTTSLRWIHDTGGSDLTLDDLDLAAELLLDACVG
ncbi:prevent-host-death protein [Cellulomonas telluris]|uniref:prevent-host-death protein n=1 Tax=Cellulomonas telluris TaxID=2306636 RepID=UPI001CA408B8|nr:prevent-host-death protein [Cellulomonas telluris]